jgi:hypothetical protein
MTLPEAMMYAAPRTRMCFLCGKPARWRAVFLPTEPRLWGGPPIRPGKRRGFFYALCRKCYRRPNKSTEVEDKILILGMGQETLQ